MMPWGISTITNGNGVAIFAESGGAGEIFRRNIEADQLGINVPVSVPLPLFSFAGDKRSIAGDGASTFYGRAGVD